MIEVSEIQFKEMLHRVLNYKTEQKAPHPPLPPQQQKLQHQLQHHQKRKPPILHELLLHMFKSYVKCMLLIKDHQ